ncbi:MAG: hypothetical protein M1819_007421 [Sarea resinae]|nr:MAG: hypothetical protein M1819_007421 [Sarea resinae]
MSSAPPTPSHHGPSTNGRSKPLPQGPAATLPSSTLKNLGMSQNERGARTRSSSESSHYWPSGPGLAETAHKTKHLPTTSVDSAGMNTFLDMDEDREDQFRDVESASGQDEESEACTERCAGRRDTCVGFTFEDLVDRLLALPMTKADSKFVAEFLCLYRMFAAPGELLDSIIRHFEALEDGATPKLDCISSQLRYVTVLVQWIADYPGDFAHSRTRRALQDFVTSLASNSIFAVAVKELTIHLGAVVEDDDTYWGCSDRDKEGGPEEPEPPSHHSSRQSSSATLNASLSSEELFQGSMSSLELSEEHTKSSRSSVDPFQYASATRSASISSASFQTLLNTLENAQRQARLLAPMPKVPLGKAQWRNLMAIPDEEIARELTRIDWILYSSIRPRDLVRHVSLRAEEKEKCRSLEYVNRMIGQFNHVAYWVTNVILLRDKPKHRAKALEKFIWIAWKLRHLNNYNALGAVIAGINGTAVHRLSQTRELVSPAAQKNFMRLEILMGTQRSHFAYRLAWENSSTERIPFLPLHRRDLVSAEHGNRTFVGEGGKRINWKKFEVMGEVVIEMQRSQATPYPNITRNEEVRGLILDGKFSKDDDELYERSICLEEPCGGSAAAIGERKKLTTWFHRQGAALTRDLW